MKRVRCAKAGIKSRHIGSAATTTTAEPIGTLADLSGHPQVHGILLQHPCGPHIDERAAFEAIAPEKDADGVTMHSVLLAHTVEAATNQLGMRHR